MRYRMHSLSAGVPAGRMFGGVGLRLPMGWFDVSKPAAGRRYNQMARRYALSSGQFQLKRRKTVRAE